MNRFFVVLRIIRGKIVLIFKTVKTNQSETEAVKESLARKSEEFKTKFKHPRAQESAQ